MKNYGDRGCYPPRPTASTDNALLSLYNSSYDTQPHLLIVNSYIMLENLSIMLYSVTLKTTNETTALCLKLCSKSSIMLD